MSDQYADALFAIGEDFDRMIARALDRGLSIDEILAEIAYQLASATENKADYE